MKIEAPEKELLALLDKPHNEQVIWLDDNEILLSGESLADLAERLWKLAAEKAEGVGLVLAMAKVWPGCPKTGLSEYANTSLWVWWGKNAPCNPIIVIVAALVALGRAGIEI